MPLSHASVIGFIPTANANAARAFYEEVLGLRFVSQDEFAVVFRVGPEPGSMLRLVCAGACQPAPFTIFGWETSKIEETVDELVAKHITFKRYGFFEQDERGIWQSPGGAKIAWFEDPDGNTLSLSQHNVK